MKMKSIFKKAISVLCAAAVVATCFSTTVFAEDTNVTLSYNLARDGEAFEDSHRNSNNQDYVNDGKMSEGKRWWQSQKVSDKDHADSFVGIEWDETVSFKNITIYWRDCGSWTTDAYVIQISTDGGKNWTTVDAEKERENLGSSYFGKDEKQEWIKCDKMYRDTVVLDKVAEADAVRIYLADGDRNVQVYEFEIYEASSDPASFSGFQTLSTVAAGEDKSLTDRLVLATIDMNDVAAGKIVKVDYDIVRNGTVEEGTVYLHEAWKSISISIENTPTTITPEVLGGTADQYVTGFFFRDLLITDTVSVVFSVVDAE